VRYQRLAKLIAEKQKLRVKWVSTANSTNSRHTHVTCATPTQLPPLVVFNSFSTKPAAKAALGLTCLFLDSLVKFLNLLVQFFSGVFPILLCFARSFCDL
jgi:hypothetical protein